MSMFSFTEEAGKKDTPYCGTPSTIEAIRPWSADYAIVKIRKGKGSIELGITRCIEEY